MNSLVYRVWPKKIRSQLILGIVVVHLVLMAIFVADLISRQKGFLKKQNNEQTHRLVSNYALNAKNFILSNDLDGLERLNHSYESFPNLKYAMALSADGKVLAHSANQYIGLRPADSVSRALKNTPQIQILLEDKTVLDMAAPVMHNDSVIGWVRVGIDQRHIYENLSGIVRNGIILMAVALVIGMLVAVSVGNRLSRGLYNLIDTTDKIRGGDRRLRVAAFKSFELSKLGIAFNQMLDEISAHERLLEMVLENMPVGVFIIDEKGSIVSANSAVKQIWGDVRLVGLDSYASYRAWFIDTQKLVKAEDWGAALAITTGQPVLNQEIEIEPFEGQRKIILNSAIPLKDDNGKIMGAIAINVDITDRKRSEAALLRMNHDIGERVKELSSLYNISRLANDREKSIEEILQACIEFIPPAYQYPEITSARIVYEQQEYRSKNFNTSQWKQIAPIRSKTNDDIGTVEVYYSRWMEEAHEGPFVKEERLLINSIADILSTTIQTRKAEFQLRQSEEKFRSLVEQSLVGVFILQNEKFVYVNPGFEKISGFSTRELSDQKTFLDFIHEDDRERVKTNYLLRFSGEKINEQYIAKAIRKDKKLIHISMIVSRIIYNEQPAVIGTVVDITGRMEEEKRINKAVNDAQEKERVQIGMELHDNVKQIIAASMMNLDFVKLKLGDRKTATEILMRVNGYLRESIEELRRISHQLAPSMDSTLTLDEKIKALVHSMNISKQLNISFDIEQMQQEVSNDVQLAFYRIVQEQFTNILKYAKATSALVDIRQKDGQLVMHIADNGVGFDTQTKKTGIGLENIKRRVQVLNGDMRIISSPDQGCDLMVHVPI